MTQSVQDEICEYLREGNYLETSAILVGVHKNTVYNWLKDGHKALTMQEQGKEISDLQRRCVSFLGAIKKAEAEAERMALLTLSSMASEAWQSIAWRLERRHPDRWGRRTAIEHSTPDGKPLRVQTLKIGDVEIEF